MGVDGWKHAKRVGETMPMAEEDRQSCLRLLKLLVNGIETEELHQTYLRTLSEPGARLDWRASYRVELEP